MAEIAVAVHDPGGNRFAQLVHDNLSVREVTLILADRLDLPTKLNYQLLDMGSGDVLKPTLSLSKAGVAAGAELQLRPVRDKAFDTFVDVLQDEIKGELKGEARRRAKDILGRLLAGEVITEARSAAGEAVDRKSTRLNSSHSSVSRMPSSA